MNAFTEAYTQLNKAQKEAVDALDGPVMVVAGPGTGKTQVLALRIANILQKTDITASGILCLTFTRSGVSAMERRLESYVGTLARNVKITTFHGFAIELIEKHFHLLDFVSTPKLLDDTEAVVLVDELLQNGEWEYLRPRTDPAKYFHDLRGLISILKRERMSPEQFLLEVEGDIKKLETDPENISSRGPSKGQLKKEVEKKIESLNRTREVVAFYTQYESLKQEHIPRLLLSPYCRCVRKLILLLILLIWIWNIHVVGEREDKTLTKLKLLFVSFINQQG